MNSKRLFRYLTIPASRPREGIRELLGDPIGLSYALALLLVQGALYTVAVYMGYRNGFGAVTAPWLAIPAADYYWWETFFAIPVFLLVAVVFAGVARLTAISLGGSGCFEQDLAVFSVALVLPTLLLLWLPEAAVMIVFPQQRAQDLGGFAFMPSSIDYTRQVAGVLWPLVITAIGLAEAEQVDIKKSLLITTLAFIPVAFLMAVFVR